MGYDANTNYQGGSATPNPAGAGQTPGSDPTAAQAGVTYWDPNKGALVQDKYLVPGMITPNSPLDSGNSQFIQPGSPQAAQASPLDAGNANYTQPPAANEGPSQNTLGQAMQNLLNMGSYADPTDITVLQQQLVKGGYLDPTKKGFNLGSISGSGDPTYSAYFQLLEQSIRTGTDFNAILQNRVDRDAGKKYEDALKLKEAKADLAQKTLERQQQLAADALVPHTIDRTKTDISDPSTAQALLTSTLTHALGRAPTTDELQQFTQSLQAAQQANPTNTIATTDPMSPYQDKTQVNTGGLDATQFATNYVNQNFGAEKDSVGEATGFYKAALQALGPGGR